MSITRSKVSEADAGGRLHVDTPSAAQAAPAASQPHQVAAAPLGPGRLEPSSAQHGVPQRAATPHLHRKQSWAERARRPPSILTSPDSEPHLDGDVRAGVSPVEDGSEAELGVSLLLEDARSHRVALTADDSVDTWSCATQDARNQTVIRLESLDFHRNHMINSERRKVLLGPIQ